MEARTPLANLPSRLNFERPKISHIIKAGTSLYPFMTHPVLGHRSYVEPYQNLPVDESEILIVTRPSHTIGALSAVGTGWDTKCRNKVRNALQTNL